MTLSSPPRRSSDLAQRQLDHLAELVDRVAHPADIVIGDVGAARLLRFLIFGTQFDLGMLVDMNDALGRSEEHTSELQSLMRNSYAVFCLKKKKSPKQTTKSIPNITQYKTNK